VQGLHSFAWDEYFQKENKHGRKKNFRTLSVLDELAKEKGLTEKDNSF